VAGYYSATRQHKRRRSTGRLSHRRLHLVIHTVSDDLVEIIAIFHT
jgi:hypothetical protein